MHRSVVYHPLANPYTMACVPHGRTSWVLPCSALTGSPLPLLANAPPKHGTLLLKQ